MKVLVACEYNQVVTKAFRERGHEAYSCDLLPTEGNPAWHIQDDVLKHLDDGWDLMIAHPPCTYLTWAGTRHWNAPDRYKKRVEAIKFFVAFAEAPINRICIENPLGIMSQVYREPDQVIHPYYFGDAEMKRTCLWLKNLPNLVYQLKDDLFAVATATRKPEPTSIDNTPTHHKRYFTDSRIRDAGQRAKTFQGIAQAMAFQWG
jgi:hypothetical protein